VHGDEGEEFKEGREFRENDLKRRTKEVRSSKEPFFKIVLLRTP
jgi:hypothetical protein